MYDEGLRALGWLNVFLVVLFFINLKIPNPSGLCFALRCLEIMTLGLSYHEGSYLGWKC